LKEVKEVGNHLVGLKVEVAYLIMVVDLMMEVGLTVWLVPLDPF